VFGEQKDRLLAALEMAHEAYYRKERFSGPCLHFHLESLKAAHEQQFDKFIESAYAMLAAWGMHRMGDGGSKMCEFDEFSSSVRKVWPHFVNLREKLRDNLVAEDWDQLRDTFCGIRCMATGTSLVGNSKVMAHMLPNLVPPVDREYTLNFLYGSKQIKNSLEYEWKKLKEMLQEFFYPVAKHPTFQREAQAWLSRRDQFRWDTSQLKIVDNLVIGFSSLPPE
jgi:hypothetical protein